MAAATQPRMHGLQHVHGGPDPLRITYEADSGGAASSFVKAMPFSISGALSVANGVLRWYPLGPGKLTTVHCAVGVPATGGAGVTVRVKKNGVSVGSVTVAAGAQTAAFTPSPATFVVGDFYSVDVTAVGTTTPGTGLVVQLGVA